MIRCIVIDDEPLALEQMARFVEKIPDLQLVGKCFCVDEAEQLLASNHVDLLFLDIEMPDISGVEFAQSLGDKAPLIIFTTAWPQYAVQGFRLDAVDYLLKPFSLQDMEEAVEKARRRLKMDGNASEEKFLSSDLSSLEENGKYIYVRCDGKVNKLLTDDLLYVQGLGEYVQIWMKDKPRALMPLLSLKWLEERLPQDHFMRVHKSYIVNLRHMSHGCRTYVKIGDKEIPVGKSFQPLFLRRLRGYLSK